MNDFERHRSLQALDDRLTELERGIIVLESRIEKTEVEASEALLELVDKGFYTPETDPTSP